VKQKFQYKDKLQLFDNQVNSSSCRSITNVNK